MAAGPGTAPSSPDRCIPSGLALPGTSHQREPLASGMVDPGGGRRWGLPLGVVLGWVSAWPGSPCGLQRGLLSKGDPSPQKRAFALQFLLEELLGLKPSQSFFRT